MGQDFLLRNPSEVDRRNPEPLPRGIHPSLCCGLLRRVVLSMGLSPSQYLPFVVSFQTKLEYQAPVVLVQPESIVGVGIGSIGVGRL